MGNSLPELVQTYPIENDNPLLLSSLLRRKSQQLDMIRKKYQEELSLGPLHGWPAITNNPT